MCGSSICSVGGISGSSVELFGRLARDFGERVLRGQADRRTQFVVGRDAVVAATLDVERAEVLDGAEAARRGGVFETGRRFGARRRDLAGRCAALRRSARRWHSPVRRSRPFKDRRQADLGNQRRVEEGDVQGDRQMPSDFFGACSDVTPIASSSARVCGLIFEVLTSTPSSPLTIEWAR